MNEAEFNELVEAIIQQGIPVELAERFAARIGDRIETDTDGLWVVRDESGQIIGRIKALRSRPE